MPSDSLRTAVCQTTTSITPSCTTTLPFTITVLTSLWLKTSKVRQERLLHTGWKQSEHKFIIRPTLVPQIPKSYTLLVIMSKPLDTIRLLKCIWVRPYRTRLLVPPHRTVQIHTVMCLPRRVTIVLRLLLRTLPLTPMVPNEKWFIYSPACFSKSTTLITWTSKETWPTCLTAIYVLGLSITTLWLFRI